MVTKLKMHASSKVGSFTFKAKIRIQSRTAFKFWINSEKHFVLYISKREKYQTIVISKW